MLTWFNCVVLELELKLMKTKRSSTDRKSNEILLDKWACCVERSEPWKLKWNFLIVLIIASDLDRRFQVTIIIDC